MKIIELRKFLSILFLDEILFIPLHFTTSSNEKYFYVHFFLLLLIIK